MTEGNDCYSKPQNFGRGRHVQITDGRLDLFRGPDDHFGRDALPTTQGLFDSPTLPRFGHDLCTGVISTSGVGGLEMDQLHTKNVASQSILAQYVPSSSSPPQCMGVGMAENCVQPQLIANPSHALEGCGASKLSVEKVRADGGRDELEFFLDSLDGDGNKSRKTSPIENTPVNAEEALKGGVERHDRVEIRGGDDEEWCIEDAEDSANDRVCLEYAPRSASPLSRAQKSNLVDSPSVFSCSDCERAFATPGTLVCPFGLTSGYSVEALRCGLISNR